MPPVSPDNGSLPSVTGLLVPSIPLILFALSSSVSPCGPKGSVPSVISVLSPSSPPSSPPSSLVSDSLGVSVIFSPTVSGVVGTGGKFGICALCLSFIILAISCASKAKLTLPGVSGSSSLKNITCVCPGLNKGRGDGLSSTIHVTIPELIPNSVLFLASMFSSKPDCSSHLCPYWRVPKAITPPRDKDAFKIPNCFHLSLFISS